MSQLDLPIYDAAEELAVLFQSSQVIVVAGETGSGKSTQLPQMVLSSGRPGLIGHTQPRRIAARAVAERVAEEMGTKLGDRVGYAVRFTDQVSRRTEIKLMTDGILLAEVQRDPLLSKYGTIIIDEAHERSLNIDFLLGYLSEILKKRNDLLVIVTSATIDTQRFSDHFGGAPIVEVSGRTYPVEVRYSEPDSEDGPGDHLNRAVETLIRQGPGDILAFFPGERQIRDAEASIKKLRLPNTEILPLYGRLSSAEQHRVFSQGSQRRIVLATNVAETSLTVPGIRYVIDTGTARISRYSQRTKVQRLPIEPISQASANQRSGRCGRLGPGIAIRLYAEDDFNNRDEFTEPEILRTSLASVILQMANLGIYDIEAFPFVDPPQTRNIADGIRLLIELGALDPDHEGTKRWLTRTGRQISRIPLDPRLARVLLASNDEGCLSEALIIASAMSVIEVRERPTGKEQQARDLHRRFDDPNSDFLSFLNLWTYLGDESKARSGNQFRKMCRNEFINYMRVREWQDVHRQLGRVAKQLKFDVNTNKADAASVHRAILSGYLSNIGLKSTKDDSYNGARNASFVIAPGSTLYKSRPKWVLAGELTETNRLYGRICGRIQPEWIEQVGGNRLTYSYSDPWWDPARGAAVTKEKVSIFGLSLVADRRINYHRVAPKHARAMFIFHALVMGEWESHHEFLEVNRQTIDSARELEARTRSLGLVLDTDQLEQWYSQRLPDSVVSASEFDKWWRRNRDKDPDLLTMSHDDVMPSGPDDETVEQFPDHLLVSGSRLEVTYELADDHTDGATVEVPAEVLNDLDAVPFGWLVPGLRPDLFETMIRWLPKEQRKPFHPISETAAELAAELSPADGDVRSALSSALVARSGLPIRPESFDGLELPSHLKLFIEVVDAESHLIASGTDLDALTDLVSSEVRSSLATRGHDLLRTGETEWTFGTLVTATQTEALGHQVELYPAVADEGTTVGVSLCETRSEQTNTHWLGVRRLLRLNVTSGIKTIIKNLSNDDQLVIASSPIGGAGALLDDCVNAAFDRGLEAHGGPCWNRDDFESLVFALRPDLPDYLAESLEAALSVLRALSSLRSKIDDSPGVIYDSAVIDIEGQIARLVYPGFVAGIGQINLVNLPRYLAAAEVRLDRLASNRNSDATNQVLIRRLEERHEALIERDGLTQELDSLGWSLEELRVAMFAQSLGTHQSVSVKKLGKRLDRLAR